MMNKKRIVDLGLLSLIFTAFCLPASAIVVADYSVATNAPLGDWDINWDNVYRYKNSSAVAVGSNWLLTAAHVADDPASSTVNVDGTDYLQQEIIFHAGSDDPQHINKADLALVRFDKTFPNHYPLYTGTFPTARKDKLNAVLIGYGVTGTVYSTYYTAAPYTDPSKGTKRWGSQRIDGPATADYDVAGTTGATYNDGIKMLFTSSDTTYEAGVGSYDSGGGTFVNDGGTWKLAGINTIRYGGPTNFTGTFGVSIPSYETWIIQMIDSVTGDLDADGIPNWWEKQYGTTTGVVATADQDGDKATGIDEYIADTDPTDSNAVFRMEGTFAITNQTFSFTGSTARKYQLLYTTNDLADSGLTWISNSTPFWGEGAGTAITVTNTETTVIYRVWVNLP